jgi:hypothetical protein
MDGEHIRVTGLDGAHGAIAFGALAMDEMGLNFPEFAAHGPDAALVSRAQPSNLRDVQGVKEDVVRKFGGRPAWHLLETRYDMDLDVASQCLEALEKSFGRRAEDRIVQMILSLDFPVVVRQLDYMHCLVIRGRVAT